MSFYKVVLKHRVEFESEVLIEADDAKAAMNALMDNFDTKQLPSTEVFRTKPGIASVKKVD